MVQIPELMLIKSGQPYELIGTETCTLEDGREIPLLVFRSYCADCGMPFEIRTSTRLNLDHGRNRRCREHSARGRRVRNPHPKSQTAAPPQDEDIF